jgi:signal peptidase II
LSRRRSLVGAALVAVAVIAADQVSKHLVSSSLDRGEKVDVVGPLQLTLTYNDGIAFGLAGGGGALVLVLSILALIALGAFVATAPRRNSTWVAGGLILGGALGNLLDRLRAGEVTDFLLLPSWPAFNIADCAITVGVAVLAWTVIRHDGKDQ